MAGIGRVSGAPYRGARHRLGHKDEFPAALVHAAIPLVLRDGQRATKRSLLYLVLDPLLRPGLLVLIPMITDTQNQSYYNTDRSGSIAPFNRPENRVGRLKNNNNNNNIRYIRRTMSWWSCYVRVSYRIASHRIPGIGSGSGNTPPG